MTHPKNTSTILDSCSHAIYSYEIIAVKHTNSRKNRLINVLLMENEGVVFGLEVRQCCDEVSDYCTQRMPYIFGKFGKYQIHALV